MLLLTAEQIETGTESLVNNKLTVSQVTDLLSIFRGYLGELADDYPIFATLTNEVDDGTNGQKCAKLAACLALFQENQFTPESGFAPTAANRTGFNYSLDGEVFETFKYAFGLFWNIPKQLTNKYIGSGANRVSTQGRFVRTSN